MPAPQPTTTPQLPPAGTAWQDVLAAHVALAVTDVQGRFIQANAALCALSGYAADDLLGQPASLFATERHTPAFFAALLRTVRETGSWRGELCNRSRDGTLFWTDTTVIAQHDAEGHTRTHVVLYHDITPAKRTAQALEDDQDRCYRLLALSTDWLWEQDAGLRFTRVTGGPEDACAAQALMLGRQRWELDVDLRDDGWTEHRATVEAHQPFRNFEYRLRVGRARDTWRWYNVSGEPVFDDAGAFAGYRGVSREITTGRTMQDRLWRLANLDTLTGLPNRMMFQERLAQAVQDGHARHQPFALALLDLDNFKEINDTLGHDGGDALLCAVARRINRVLRQSDLVARIGGDEFAIILHGANSVASLLRPLDALRNTMAEPIPVGHEERRCTFSMGLTLFPDDAQDGSDLVKNADIALYRAKAAGRNRVEFFQLDMRSAVQRRVSLCREMELALQQDDLLMHYQPVVDLAQGRVIGVEALLRWRHATLGLLTPGTFARAFDDPGLAARLGQRVVQLTVAQARRWLDEGLNFGRLAINVVAADFASERFADNLAQVLQAHNVPATCMAVEVTEGMFLGRPASQATAMLQALHGMGVELAFDDFGTGYASLTHLKNLPIDRLKIDRSFITDLTHDEADASIVLAIIQLGKSLGKAITAEGVETEQQTTLLRRMGCDVHQGFAHARPMPAAEIAGFVQRFALQQRAAAGMYRWPLRIATRPPEAPLLPSHALPALPGGHRSSNAPR